MFSDWSDFYLFVGSAAAVLIGLIFVVISLMQDRSRSTVIEGSKLYMGPIVLSVSFVLIISGAALVPGMGGGRFGGIIGLIALWGLVRSIMSASGIWRLRSAGEVHWTDAWFYGVIPSVLYLALGITAFAFVDGKRWAGEALATVVIGILLTAIRNEWDLITWIAPRSDSSDPQFEQLQHGE